MNTIIKDVRHLSSKHSDRVLFLLNRVSCDKVFSDTMINYLRLVHIKHDVKKCIFLLEKIESHLLKKSEYNFMISNIPEYGIVSSTRVNEKIGYIHIRDTLEQFGKVDTLDIIRGTAYVKFANKDTSIITHNTINKKLLGNQIIHTFVV